MPGNEIPALMLALIPHHVRFGLGWNRIAVGDDTIVEPGLPVEAVNGAEIAPARSNVGSERLQPFDGFRIPFQLRAPARAQFCYVLANPHDALLDRGMCITAECI